MNRSIMFVGLLLSVMLVMAGCSTPQPMTSFTPQDFDAQLRSGKYEPKVDNFIVVFDASSSMSESYEGSVHAGHSKFAVAKDLVHRMNVTMPALPIQGGMTAFGLDPNVSKNPTTVVYGPTDYTEAGLEEGLTAINAPGGTTPLGLGLASAGEMLKDARGKVAVILFSDGKENTTTTAGTEAAEALKQQFGPNLCLHTVFVGNTEEGRQLMSSLAAASECGLASSADEIVSSDGMADFVEKVFLAAAKPMAKPAPPPPPPLPQPKITWILSGVNFDFNSDVVRPDAKEILKSDIKILRENPQIRVEVQGHTCDLGPADYNRELSDRRAQSIKEYLISQGVARNRLESRGYGEDRPRFPNDGEENRARNRRVELVPLN
ncbi:MAG: OmpA family protein [Desulfobacterales bacterium]|nr:OmpA family protein [Desulfobacterales bacterium]